MKRASNNSDSKRAAVERPASPAEQPLDWPQPWEVPVKVWKQHQQKTSAYQKAKVLNDYARNSELEKAAAVAAERKKDIEEAYPDVITPELRLNQDSARSIRGSSKSSVISPPILSPKATRRFTQSGADQLRKLWADEKMQHVKDTLFSVEKAPVLEQLKNSNSRINETLRQVEKLPDVVGRTHVPRPLTPRAELSWKKSVALQEQLALGVRKTAAAVRAKAKLLKATMMLQRVARGSILVFVFVWISLLCR